MPLNPAPTPTGDLAPARAPDLALLNQNILEEASALIEPKTLHLLAAVPELQRLERDILFRLGQYEAHQEAPDRRIANFFASYLKILKMRYHYIIIDCPPGISAFTAAAVRDADAIIAPGMPDYLSILGLQVFAESVLRPLGKEVGHRPARALLNRVRQVAAHDEYREEMHALTRRMSDVLEMFPFEIEQSPDLEAASSGGDKIVSIREKYRQAIPTLERFAAAVVDHL